MNLRHLRPAAADSRNPRNADSGRGGCGGGNGRRKERNTNDESGEKMRRATMIGRERLLGKRRWRGRASPIIKWRVVMGQPYLSVCSTKGQRKVKQPL